MQNNNNLCINRQNNGKGNQMLMHFQLQLIELIQAVAAYANAVAHQVDSFKLMPFGWVLRATSLTIFRRLSNLFQAIPSIPSI